MERTSEQQTEAGEPSALHFDFGSFEGFNFRNQSAIEQTLSAHDVVSWNHDTMGEAEFWPAGDHCGVALVFRGRNSVGACELIALDRLLQEMNGDPIDNFLKIHYAVAIRGARLDELTAAEIEDTFVHVFMGVSFGDVRRAAAYELFELYYPEEFLVWEKTTCDGLHFDTDRFLASPAFWVEEVQLGETVALLISPH